MSEEPEVPDVPEDVPAKASVPWASLILIMLAIPVVTVVVMEFVVIPKLAKSMVSELSSDHGAAAAAGGDAAAVAAAAESDGGHGAAAEEKSGGGHGGGSASAPLNRMVFDKMVTNVAGTKGTRFLHVTFEIMGQDSRLRSLVKERKSQVNDAVITVLANQTIQGLEATGGRNMLRISLIDGINTALDLSIVEELYFLEMIIQ
jgi:flagellar basal body-associated protein FliL